MQQNCTLKSLIIYKRDVHTIILRNTQTFQLADPNPLQLIAILVHHFVQEPYYEKRTSPVLTHQ